MQARPGPSTRFKTVAGAPTPFAQPEGDLEARWEAWLAWEAAFQRYCGRNPDLADVCEDILHESVPEIPDQPWVLAWEEI